MEEQEINEETLKSSVRGHKHSSAFRMIEALALKQLPLALEILDQQLREAPRDQVRLFSLVILQYRRLLNLNYLQQMHIPEAELPQKIRLSRNLILTTKFISLFRKYKLLARMYKPPSSNGISLWQEIICEQW